MVRYGYRILCCLGLCVGIELSGSTAPARAKPNREATLLIVPARPRLVQLAADLAYLRPVAIVSCRGDARAADPLLFAWSNGEWQYVSADDFRERRFLAEWPPQVVMIGDDQTLPAHLEEEASWGATVTRLKTLQVADLINSLDAVFKFTDREWKWLAKRYDLKLTDINAPRRQFNPYDIPRSKLQLETTEFKQEEGDTAPAVLIESPAETPLPPAVPKAKEPSLK